MKSLPCAALLLAMLTPPGMPAAAADTLGQLMALLSQRRHGLADF